MERKVNQSSKEEPYFFKIVFPFLLHEAFVDTGNGIKMKDNIGNRYELGHLASSVEKPKKDSRESSQ